VLGSHGALPPELNITIILELDNLTSRMPELVGNLPRIPVNVIDLEKSNVIRTIGVLVGSVSITSRFLTNDTFTTGLTPV
jgi:hypothetical protein